MKRVVCALALAVLISLSAHSADKPGKYMSRSGKHEIRSGRSAVLPHAHHEFGVWFIKDTLAGKLTFGSTLHQFLVAISIKADQGRMEPETPLLDGPPDTGKQRLRPDTDEDPWEEAK